ncbi:helix-turn-helix transcriptional regulator [Sphingomonas sp. LaA6.9]|uniref:ArsR/SmtB family transcription factor n=1 Tax=Sphingomonas sp. LaA6.9 TaxID=2919914 RepID=UPI001F4F2E90|nr:metalloregulator ArsR/SmtB family transcription factor [Sphingomonas sp. LaA6.9]MCJ8159451.1 metalloregulator ArsR/SmtB family transcription factor [Sphingomonas sp. LaA6.9]
MTDIFRALADESRRALLDKLMAENGQSLSQLCEGLPMTRQAVTKHLAILESAGLVSVRRQGRERLHFLNPVPLIQIVRRWIGKFEDVRLLELLDREAGYGARKPLPARVAEGFAV